MAPGRVHFLTTLALTGVTAASMAGNHPAPVIVAICAGCMTGAIISPDMDVRGMIQPKAMMTRFHTLIGLVWMLIWWPYARIIPRHRHPLSHWPLVGTLGRVFYIGVITWVIWKTASPWLGMPFIPWWFWWSVSGLVLADFGHWVMDMPRWN